MEESKYKILCLVQAYPYLDGTKQLMYVHVRNMYYKKNGLDITVLNFSTDCDYFVDEIKVISEKTFYKDNNCYDLILCHAPNIKNHYRFLQKNKEFKKVLFFFHGHEVLKINEAYPEPYYFKKGKFYKLKRIIQYVYDCFKLYLWKNYFLKKNNIILIFVSEYLYRCFLNNMKSKKIEDINYYIINNSVSEIFEKCTYNLNIQKKYDFITIRSNIDSSTYCIDIINNLAKRFPQYNFLLIGKGNYFNFYEKAKNIEFINSHLEHNEMIDYINSAYCALMPTRNDTQGVMSCELATFGIPLITSNIEICHEVFANFDNVYYLDNNSDLDCIYKKIKDSNSIIKNETYFYKNTVRKEIDLIFKLKKIGNKVD